MGPLFSGDGSFLGRCDLHGLVLALHLHRLGIPIAEAADVVGHVCHVRPVEIMQLGLSRVIQLM